MARGIYQIILKQNLFPALSEKDALETQDTINIDALDREADIEAILVVNEEDTMKLFTLAKTMQDLEKFDHREIEAAVRAMAIQMGHYSRVAQVVNTIMLWTERMDYLTPGEFEEWMIG